MKKQDVIAVISSKVDNVSPEKVLLKALQRVMNELGLNLEQLAQIIGKSGPTLSRLFRDPAPKMNIESKEAELALLLIRGYRALAAIIGDDRDKCRAWFHTHNTYFDAKPIEAALTVEGLVNVCRYLDAMRAKV